jgi:hypothetical protein
MSSTYDGDETNYPTSITVPSDGDGPGIKAADVNAAIEGLADRTAYLSRHTSGVSYTFDNNVGTLFSTSDTAWDDAVSDGVYVDVENCEVGDKIFATMTGIYRCTGTAGHTFEARLLAIDDQGTTNAEVPIVGARASLLDGVPATGMRFPMAMSGVHTVTVAGTTRITLQGQVQNGADTILFSTALTLFAQRTQG